MKFFEIYRDTRYTPPEIEAWLLNTFSYGSLYFSVKSKGGKWEEYQSWQREVCCLHD